LAIALAKQLRVYDNIFFRFGGEEFLLCLPGISPEALPIALERVRRAVEDLRLALEDGQEVRVTASLGAAFFQSGADVDDAFRRADEALYAAKRAGRNRVHIAWSPQDLSAGSP
jgi:diguanylate cyclase (GGDEF)-like protein